MRTAKSGFVAMSVVGLIGTALAAARHEAPADALAPANDVVAQLEQRIVRLEARVAELEQRVPSPLVAPAVFWPTPSTASTAPPTIPPVPFAVPPPHPGTEEREANGVKFRIYLLGSESPATPR